MGIAGQYLWEGFSPEWAAGTNPSVSPRSGGDHGSALFRKRLGRISAALNTIILLTSSFTVHFAHVGKSRDRKKLIGWLSLTVLLGVVFLFLQVEEYIHAYEELAWLESGIYGSTFFILTGFHGFHVTLGTFMLAMMLVRAVKGHFRPDDHFAFEASSWYWHFVDVVWLGLFIFVYIV